MTSAFSWQNAVNLCPVSFCTPRPNLPITQGISWLPTFAFQSHVVKRTSFLAVSSRRSCVHQDPGERSMTPQETDPDLPVSVQESVWRRGSVVACCRVGGTECGSEHMGLFEGGLHYLHYPHHSLASGQTTETEHSPTNQQKIGLKNDGAWPCPSEQDPVSPSVSPIRKLP